MKIHLDADIGGDMDDLCALALVLSAPEAELVGVTTVAEEHGRRAQRPQPIRQLVSCASKREERRYGRRSARAGQ